MAKQSGLHQIKGKVGEHSYYRQSGVESGLIRRINQGMSNRVKTSAEFANTRLNNKEFKVAANMAKAFGLMIVPKFRPMLLTFSQAKLTKSFLEILKQNAGSWGLRYLINTNNSQMLDALNSLAKKSFTDLIGRVELGEGAEPGSIVASVFLGEDKVNELLALGINGISYRAQYRSIYGAKYDGDTFSLYIGRVTAPAVVEEDIEAGTSYQTQLEVTETAHTAWTDSNRIFDEIAIVAMPYRTINGVNHVLQEMCTYTVVEAPSRA